MSSSPFICRGIHFNYNSQITERKIQDMKERFSEQSTPSLLFRRDNIVLSFDF